MLYIVLYVPTAYSNELCRHKLYCLFHYTINGYFHCYKKKSVSFFYFHFILYMCGFFIRQKKDKNNERKKESLILTIMLPIYLLYAFDKIVQKKNYTDVHNITFYFWFKWALNQFSRT